MLRSATKTCKRHKGKFIAGYYELIHATFPVCVTINKDFEPPAIWIG